MEWIIGVMVAIMIIGFLGFGNHHGMMGGHGKEEQKQEKVLHEHGKDAPCPEIDCPSHAMPEKENKGSSAEEK